MLNNQSAVRAHAVCTPLPQILSLLTEQEVMSVVPSQAIVPRTFVLKPSMSLFVGALARIDFLQVIIIQRSILNQYLHYLFITPHSDLCLCEV